MNDGGQVTTADALREAAARLAQTSDTARLDAEVLMAHALAVSRSDLLLRHLGDSAPPIFAALLDRRLAHEPVAYIVGEQPFFGLDLLVTSDVLIPRGDSEVLVEQALALRPDARRVLDCGTGSGALLLAVGTTVYKALGHSLMPVALVSQSMPLVALTPLVVLVFGRGTASILVITISVTFFPAFVTIAQGLALVPSSATDFVRVYGAGRWRQLRLIALPWALPYLCAAARLAAPRAFLGVMIAEWLATGTGIGNLLNVSRGVLDFGMIWSVAVVAILIAVALNSLVVVLERYVLQRYAMAPAA